MINTNFHVIPINVFSKTERPGIADPRELFPSEFEDENKYTFTGLSKEVFIQEKKWF